MSMSLSWDRIRMILGVRIDADRQGGKQAEADLLSDTVQQKKLEDLIVRESQRK